LFSIENQQSVNQSIVHVYFILWSAKTGFEVGKKRFSDCLKKVLWSGKNGFVIGQDWF